MDARVGGSWSLWNGEIIGVNLEVEPDRLLVQNWKLDKWSDYSRVAITLRENGEETELDLLHERVPEAEYDSLDSGWKDYYFGPLKELVESGEK